MKKKSWRWYLRSLTDTWHRYAHRPSTTALTKSVYI